MRQMRFGAETRLSLLSKVLNYLYPAACPVCSLPADDWKTAPFCARCWLGIQKYQGSSCRICGVPFSSEFGQVCGECLRKPPLFSKAISFGLYQDTLAAAINHFKFHKIRRLDKPLGTLLLNLDIAADAIIPVPLSIGALRERGFNQSLLLAKIISDRFRIPLLLDHLVKTRETRPQVGLSAKERSSNLRDAYRSTGGLSGMDLLLVDDVMTTGATGNECAKQLLKAGAKGVEIVTLARASIL